MIRQADLLAFCRAGLDRESIIAILSAITSRMKQEDPACIALDKANDTLMSLQEATREAEQWEADDRACRRGAAANTVGGIPSFLTREAA